MSPLAMKRAQRGASLVEMTLVVPTLLVLVMEAWQAATAYHAKSVLNHATLDATLGATFAGVFKAAPAGIGSNVRSRSVQTDFQNTMLMA